MSLPIGLIQEIISIWQTAQNRACTLVNQAMIDAYWHIGQRIIREEQKGNPKAHYGTFLLKALATTLTEELDKHLDERELRRIRQFYCCFSQRQDLRPELSWSHYRLLIRVEDTTARHFYTQEAATQGWSTRQLERNIQSQYYLRILSNKAQPTLPAPRPDEPRPTAQDLLKDPYILEFLALDIPTGFSENDLEEAILSKLQLFLLEMGRGFAFVARQYSIRTETKQYYIDLVFYNFILKCFVLAELKISELTHQDIGQMDMYVRLFEDTKKIPGDNPTIGIILCSEKDETLVRYSVLSGSEQLFAARYRMILPTEEELSRAIQKQTDLFKEEQRGNT